MKKLIALLLVMLMVVGMFAGCGETEPANTDPNQGGSTEGTSSGKETVELTWWTYESEINTPIFKKWLAKFHEDYDWIKINVTYLFGKKGEIVYGIIAVICVFLGTVAGNDLVWDVQDTLNQLMVLPNALALIALSGTVVACCNKYAGKKDTDDKND